MNFVVSVWNQLSQQWLTGFAKSDEDDNKKISPGCSIVVLKVGWHRAPYGANHVLMLVVVMVKMVNTINDTMP